MLKRWLPWLLKGALSVGLTGWVLSKVDLHAAWRQAGTLDPAMAWLGVGLMMVQIALGAVRWWVVLRALSCAFPAVRAVLVYYIGVFFAIVLPGAVGGDAVRMWQAHRAGLSLSHAVNSVMLERVATVLGLVLLVAATQPLLLARAPDIPGTWVFPLLSVAGLAGIAVLAVLDRLPVSLHRWGVVRGLAKLAADTRRLFFRPAWALPTLAVAVLGHINLSLVVFALARGLGVEVDVIDCLVLFPPVVLLMTLPISIAGWGVRETAMVVAFGFVGVSDDSAVVVSVLFGILTMVSALPGGLIWLLSGQKLRPEELKEVEDAQA